MVDNSPLWTYLLMSDRSKNCYCMYFVNLVCFLLSSLLDANIILFAVFMLMIPKNISTVSNINHLGHANHYLLLATQLVPLTVRQCELPGVKKVVTTENW